MRISDWSSDVCSSDLCQAFVAAVAETRKLLPDAGFHDAIYVERLSRVLPCYTPAPRTDDATVVGFWITGGVNVSILSTRRMRSLAPWLKARQLNQLEIGRASCRERVC